MNTIAEDYELVDSFDRNYCAYSDGDGVSNVRALEKVFGNTIWTNAWIFTLYLGLGIESIESVLWLTETFFLNNLDISL